MIQEIIQQGGLATEFNNVGLSEILIIGCWYIWWQRRRVVHGDEIQIPPRAAISIAAITTNYALAPKASNVINNKWKKPAKGFFMINVDGSFAEITGDGSTVVVIRDALGGFIAASYSYISHGGSLCVDRWTLIGTTDWFSYWHNILVPIMCKSKRTVWMWLIQCLMEGFQLRLRRLSMRIAINYGKILLQFRLPIVIWRVIE